MIEVVYNNGKANSISFIKRVINWHSWIKFLSNSKHVVNLKLLVSTDNTNAALIKVIFWVFVLKVDNDVDGSFGLTGKITTYSNLVFNCFFFNRFWKNHPRKVGQI